MSARESGERCGATVAVMSISAVDVITTKRDRGRLSDEQIDWVLAGYTRGDVAHEP